jgi:ankyrin repeat protein
MALLSRPNPLHRPTGGRDCQPASTGGPSRRRSFDFAVKKWPVYHFFSEQNETDPLDQLKTIIIQGGSVMKRLTTFWVGMILTGLLAGVAPAESPDPLFEAVRARTPDAVKRLITGGADVNAPAPNGLLPLILAAWQGDVEIVGVLLDAGARVDGEGPGGVTALMAAAGGGHEAVVRLLLDRGADVNARRKDGYTALMYAALTGRLTVVDQLVMKGAAVNARTDAGWTALMAAVSGGQTAAAALLLDHGADPGARMQGGATPLMVAVGNGREAAVRLLLERGADPSIRDDQGNTAADLAGRLGYSMIQALFAASGGSGVTEGQR